VGDIYIGVPPSPKSGGRVPSVPAYGYSHAIASVTAAAALVVAAAAVCGCNWYCPWRLMMAYVNVVKSI